MFVCKRNPPSIVNNRSEFPKVDHYSCRAEDDTWCVLNLNVQEGIELLKMLEEIQKTI